MAESRRILIVEDSLTFRDLIQFCIQNLYENIDFDFVVLKHGEGAISYLEKNKDIVIDLIISDIMMPGDVSGYDLLDYVHRTKRLSDIPFFLVTGGVEDSTQLHIAKQQCTEFFQKPIDIKHLQKLLLKWLKIES